MLAPNIFEIYDVAKILKQPTSEEEKDSANYAIISCPTQAIETIKKLEKELSKR